MILRVLGSSGAEFPGCHPPAFLVDGSLLLDAGTIGAVLGEKEQRRIRNILLTHAHLDHIRGIPFLADNIMLRDGSHNVTVTGISPVLAALKRNLLNGVVWPDFTSIPGDGNPVIRLRGIAPGRAFDVDGYRVTAHRVNHSVPATGFVIEDRRGKRLLYTGDTGPTDRIWRETAKPVHCAIVEVSMPDRMKEMAVLTGHLTAGLLREEIKKMKNMPGMMLITHPKPQYLKAITGELRKLRISNLRMLREGEVYRI
jgi:ribonuclease BN (tRNA processing enzyme)